MKQLKNYQAKSLSNNLYKTLKRKKSNNQLLQNHKQDNKYSNNSFLTMLQPKRTSLDIRLFLQLHRKKVRTNVIQRRFQKNNNCFNQVKTQNQKGFRGSKINSYQKYKNSKYTTVDGNDSQQNSAQPRGATYQIQINNRLKTQGHAQRPNLMYNLTLYRKNFRKNANLHMINGNSFKNNHIKKTMMQKSSNRKSNMSDRISYQS